MRQAQSLCLVASCLISVSLCARNVGTIVHDFAVNSANSVTVLFPAELLRADSTAPSDVSLATLGHYERYVVRLKRCNTHLRAAETHSEPSFIFKNTFIVISAI